jgi:hypothetical protein
VLVDWRFGMKVCGLHRPNAERDCRAYLHRQNFVRIEDAMKIPALKKFLDVLAVHPQLVVERTNGTMDDDWSLRIGSPMEPAFFSKNEERWGVPLYNKRLNLNKTVPFRLVITVELAVSFTMLVLIICVTVPRFGGVVDTVSNTLSITFWVTVLM